MKNGLVLYILLSAAFVLRPAGAGAQHFISVQSADYFPFAVNINGINFNSSKSGLFRVSNLSAGMYKLLISFPGNKYPAQNFSCAVGKDDVSYSLKNLGRTGWVLKNIKNGQVVQPLDNVLDDETEGRAQQKPNGFAHMLAEVANDSELLKPTVWVYTNKLDGQQDTAAPMESQNGKDTDNYEIATKGVIKVSEEYVNGGKAFVFYDFNANGGDTIHLMVPSVETAGNAVADTAGVAKNNVAGGDSTISNKQSAVNNAAYNGGGDSLLIGQGHHRPVQDTAAAFDTTTNRQLTNPFFKKDTGITTLPVSIPVADTIGQVSSSGASNPVDTVQQKQPDIAAPVSGNAIQTNGNTGGAQSDTALQKPVVTAAPAAGSGLQTNTDITTPRSGADTSQQKPSGDTARHILYVRDGCNNMLTDNGAEKLKRKIYLESDENKMVDIAKRYLNGKCITVEQVKALANFFLSDDSRLNFFKAVYPFVYDYGNFSTLESYMIDKNYKEMFRAILK